MDMAPEAHPNTYFLRRRCAAQLLRQERAKKPFASKKIGFVPGQDPLPNFGFFVKDLSRDEYLGEMLQSALS